MKQYMFNILIMFIVICLIIFSFSFGFSSIKVIINHYKNPYLKELKIPLDWKISSIIDVYGEPISMVEYNDNNYCGYTYKYDGFSLSINKQEYDNNKKNARFNCIIIYGRQYKFTKKNIGMGTKCDEIVSYYKDNKSIKDLTKDKIGYIIDGYWIYFTFDSNKCLNEIRITYGL